MEIFDVHFDLVSRFDVGHGLGEDIGALFGEERGDVALAASLLVDRLGFLAFADDAANPALAEAHDELVDGGVVGQRKDIDRLDFARVGVVELLSDFHCADVTADGGVDAGVLEGHGDFLLLEPGQQGTGARAFIRALGDGFAAAGDDPEFFACHCG